MKVVSKYLGVAVWVIMGLVVLGAIEAPGDSRLDKWTVCQNPFLFCPYSKIQEAIDASGDWDTITIAPGTYVENLEIRKSLRLIGAGKQQVRINPADPSKPTIFIANAPPRVISDLPVQVHLKGFSIVGPNTQSPPASKEKEDRGRAGIVIQLHALVIAQDLKITGYSYGVYGFIADYLALLDTEISHNGYGMEFFGLNLLILNSQVLDNTVGLQITSGFLTMRDNVLLRNGLGAHLQGGADAIIASNWVEENKVGFLLEELTDSPYEILIGGNMISGNRYYGIVLSDPTCSWEEMKLEKSRGPIKVRGAGNEMYFNGQDLCPADYPWPPGFKRP